MELPPIPLPVSRLMIYVGLEHLSSVPAWSTQCAPGAEDWVSLCLAVPYYGERLLMEPPSLRPGFNRASSGSQHQAAAIAAAAAAALCSPFSPAFTERYWFVTLEGGGWSSDWLLLSRRVRPYILSFVLVSLRRTIEQAGSFCWADWRCNRGKPWCCRYFEQLCLF